METPVHALQGPFFPELTVPPQERMIDPDLKNEFLAPAGEEREKFAAKLYALYHGAIQYLLRLPDKKRRERHARTEQEARMLKDQEALLLWRTLRDQAHARRPFGPFLAFTGHDPTSHVHHISVLVITHGVQPRAPEMVQTQASDDGASTSSQAGPEDGGRGAPWATISGDIGAGEHKVPQLQYREYFEETPIGNVNRRAAHQQGARKGKKLEWTHVKPEMIHDHKGIRFWRWSLTLQCKEEEQIIEYALEDPNEGTDPARYHFWLPSAHQPWHMGFFSSNSFRTNMGRAQALKGIQPRWRNVLALHNKRPLHLMISGGDALCNDAVWGCASLKSWAEIPNIQERNAHPFTAQMQDEVEDCYLRMYLQHWREDEWSGALAVIPHVFSWDDHEIFDAWGCYAPDLQNSAVFQGIFKSAIKFFSLFAHHASYAMLARQRQIFGAGLHSLTCCGPSQALLLLDTRSERSKEQIISENSYQMIEDKLLSLPVTVKHIMVVTAAPLIYPVVPGAMTTAKCFSLFGQGMNVGKMLHESSAPFLEAFGGIGVINDVIGHWSADLHVQEKANFVALLQRVSQTKSARILLLAGDTRMACVGKFFSSSSMVPSEDHRYMPQIVSSAIGDAPPPASLVGILRARSMFSNRLDAHTNEQLESSLGLRPQRNWCEIAGTATDNTLVFKLHFEQETQPFVVEVPPLLLPRHDGGNNEGQHLPSKEQPA